MVSAKIYKSLVSRLNRTGEMLLQKESSHQTLVWSCCAGVFVAFSPFICLHTVMILLFGWFCSLNISIMFAVSWFINNPWTMVPIYAFDCVVGNWLFSCMGIDYMQLNPSWMVDFNRFIATYTGLTSISIWSFLIGGNLFAIIISGILYPFFNFFFMYIRRSSRTLVN